MDIFSNAWFVGIVGGIISGLIVWLCTNRFFQSKKTREYIQKTESVNREIIFSLRASISENVLPTENVLNSIKNATCRRFGVKPDDIYSNKEIAEELIKEVMDSSFIPFSAKGDFFNLVEPMLREDYPKKHTSDNKVSIINKSLYSEAMSSLLAMTAALMTSIVILIPEFEQLKNKLNLTESRLFLIGICLSVLIVLAMTLLVYYKIQKSRLERRRDLVLWQKMYFEKMKK